MTIALATVLVIPISDASHSPQVQAMMTEVGNGSIICSVMEAFEEGKLGVRAIAFHQRNKADRPRQGSVL